MRSLRCSTGIFQMRENSRKFDFAKNSRLQRLQRESCCTARIETRSKHATSVEIKLALQLVACAACDAAQEFSKCEKIQENLILRKIRVCNACNERAAARHASKPGRSMPRAWKLSWLCNW